MNRKWTIHTAINLLMVLLLLGTPYLFPLCTGTIATASGGTTPMKCHWSMLAELALGIPLLLMVISQFVLKDSATRKLSAGFLLPLGLMVIIIPQKFFIGVCKSGMPCSTSKLVWIILGSVLILNALLQIRLSARQKRYKL